MDNKSIAGELVKVARGIISANIDFDWEIQQVRKDSISLLDEFHYVHMKEMGMEMTQEYYDIIKKAAEKDLKSKTPSILKALEKFGITKIDPWVRLDVSGRTLYVYGTVSFLYDYGPRDVENALKQIF